MFYAELRTLLSYEHSSVHDCPDNRGSSVMKIRLKT